MRGGVIGYKATKLLRKNNLGAMVFIGEITLLGNEEDIPGASATERN